MCMEKSKIMAAPTFIGYAAQKNIFAKCQIGVSKTEFLGNIVA